MLNKNILAIITILLYLFISTPIVSANHIGAGGTCVPADPNSHCITGYSCQFDGPSKTYLCDEDPFGENFGKIQPPDPLKNLVGHDPTGAGGINVFLSNLVALFYTVAGIVLIFMLIWGAFEWMTSGGEKEKIESARRRIISAIIGITLFAVAFAVIQVLGVFTGFKFFVGQV